MQYQDQNPVINSLFKASSAANWITVHRWWQSVEDGDGEDGDGNGEVGFGDVILASISWQVLTINSVSLLAARPAPDLKCQFDDRRDAWWCGNLLNNIPSSLPSSFLVLPPPSSLLPLHHLPHPLILASFRSQLSRKRILNSLQTTSSMDIFGHTKKSLVEWTMHLLKLIIWFIC